MKNLFLVLLTLGLITVYNIDKQTESKISSLIKFNRQPASSQKDDGIDAFPEWKSKSGYMFVYYYKGTRLEIEKTGSSTTAFSAAAKECFKYFIKKADLSKSDEEGLDIIDVCANPKKS